VKIAALFFLLITHVCGALAFWAARHTTVCLDLLMQKQPSCEKVVRPSKVWVKKVRKSKVAAKNGCNDNSNCCGIIVKFY